jgi:hypothetical protein
MKLQDLQLRNALELLGQLKETMKVTVENTHQMVCKWDNVLEIVQELEQEEAYAEQLKNMPTLLGSVVDQKVESFVDLNQNGVLNDDV